MTYDEKLVALKATHDAFVRADRAREALRVQRRDLIRDLIRNHGENGRSLEPFLGLSHARIYQIAGPKLTEETHDAA